MVVAVPQLDVLKNSARDVDAREARVGPEPARLGLVPARPVLDDLEVAPGVDTAWRKLPLDLRYRVASLFDRSRAPAACTFEVVGPMPEDFAHDIAGGGCGFRTAFPALRRRIAAIVLKPSHTFVRVACQGQHDAPFFDLLAPTKRVVEFDVVHRLVIGPDDVIVDHIVLDLRAIVVQLARSCPRPATLDSVLVE